MEQEYYFKVCSHLAFIYNQKKDYISAIRYAERALDFKNDVYKERKNATGYDKMYYDIYGDLSGSINGVNAWDPEEIINVELKRMSSKNIYYHLAVAYQGLGIDDVASEYWKLIKR